MPRAEAGTTKAIANQLKSKGLQRLRWWCEVCAKQCRDANGFKMHTSSESHVRNLLVVGQNAKKHIDDYTSQFRSNFLHLLKTAHGTKMVHANHFYQEYISDKEHVHLNATRFHSLSELVKTLGREGVVRVEEGERGLEMGWVDNSPDALRRAEAVRKRERMERGDEEREQRLIREQVERAQRDAENREDGEGEEGGDVVVGGDRELQREDGRKIMLNFGGKGVGLAATTTTTTTAATAAAAAAEEEVVVNGAPAQVDEEVVPDIKAEEEREEDDQQDDKKNIIPPQDAEPKILLSLGASKSKNVFAAASTSKKNALSGSKTFKPAAQRPISEAERIMKEELARKRRREVQGFQNSGFKKQKT